MNQYYRDNKLICEVGLAIKRRRYELGLSQESLANALGFTQTHIARIESGKVNTSISHLSAIVKELGISLTQLFAML